LASFNSLAGKPILGPWSAEHVTPSAGGAPVPAAATVVSGETEAAAAPVEAPSAPASEAPAAAEPAPAEPAAAADAELDALLASLNAPAEPAPAAADAAAEDAIDPELAALLADL
jgi:hypothetical protein